MRQYNFGECIPESVKIYNRLKKQSKTPLMVEGWVEVNYSEIEPNREFLELYYPDILKIIDNDLEFDDYIRVLSHTWIICDGQIIDKTRNQFDELGGIIRYYEKCRYMAKDNKSLKADDLINWFDDRNYHIKYNRYIRYPDEIKAK